MLYQDEVGEEVVEEVGDGEEVVDRTSSHPRRRLFMQLYRREHGPGRLLIRFGPTQMKYPTTFNPVIKLTLRQRP